MSADGYFTLDKGIFLFTSTFESPKNIYLVTFSMLLVTI
uniref:Uncharacterized protein n=1 Tax=Rhizophora mucronata TaxID=61149 RepID=A0A2P2IHW6_RHIMU